MELRKVNHFVNTTIELVRIYEKLSPRDKVIAKYMFNRAHNDHKYNLRPCKCRTYKI